MNTKVVEAFSSALSRRIASAGLSRPLLQPSQERTALYCYSRSCTIATAVFFYYSNDSTITIVVSSKGAAG